MAGFKGFGFESPEEVRARTIQGFQQAMASGNPNAQRMAVAQMGAFAVGGSPELRKAKKTQQIFTQAQKNADRSGDEIADQMAFLEEAQRLAVEAELPEIAMQATQQLAGWRLQEEERARLKTQEERAAAKEGREQEVFEMQKEVDKQSLRHLRNRIVVDPDSLEIIDRIDMTNSDDLIRLEKLKAENPRLQDITESDFIGLNEAEKDRKARLASQGSGWGGRSQLYKKWYEKSQSTDAFATTADDFVDLLLLEDAQQIFGAGGAIKNVFERAGAHARSFIGQEGAERVEERFAEDARFNTLSSEKKALIMELGYALATSREGGRLTDQDVERAIVTLGVDNPDPRAVAWIFGRAMQRTRDNYARSLTTSGIEDIEDVRKTHKLVRGSLDESLARLESKYKIDFEDEDEFKKYTDPKGSFNDDKDEDGVVVREVGGQGRNRRRVVN